MLQRLPKTRTFRYYPIAALELSEPLARPLLISVALNRLMVLEPVVTVSSLRRLQMRTSVAVGCDFAQDARVTSFSPNLETTSQGLRHSMTLELVTSADAKLTPTLSLRNVEHPADLNLVAIVSDDDVAVVLELSARVRERKAVRGPVDLPEAGKSAASHVPRIGIREDLLAPLPPSGTIGLSYSE
jgi:hypothetical protein